MLVVDTNVLVYAANAELPISPGVQAGARGVAARPGRLVRHLGHPLRVPPGDDPPQGTVAGVVGRAGVELRESRCWPRRGSGVLVATARHAAVVAEVLRDGPHLSGNLIHDAHTAVLMREHGIARIYTRDTDFHRFPWVEVVDPPATPESAGPATSR